MRAILHLALGGTNMQPMRDHLARIREKLTAWWEHADQKNPCLLIALPIEGDAPLERTGDLRRCWFDEVERLIESAGNPGGIGWAGIWAPGRTLPLQEDFSYNLSPAMFREFLLPSLRELAEAMPYPMFHLDGTTNHVASLLEIPGLKAIQWVPATNRQRIAQWYDLLRAIKAKGKSIEVFCTADEVDDLVAAVGSRSTHLRAV